MGTVNIGIRHDNNFAIAQLAEIQFITDTTAECCNNGHELVVAIDFVQTGFFDIQHFAP